MIDGTSTNNSMLLTESPSVTSIDLHRSDSHTELKNYHINYIDDRSMQTDLKRLDMNEDRTSMSVIEEHSCRLEVSQLVEEIFSDKNIQCEFECIFHEFDPEVIISYSKIFQRAHLTFSDPILALQVRTIMNGKEFHHQKLHLSYTSSTYLKPPRQDRIFMQSPPTTPPIGWVAQREELPEINFDLFLALSKLQPDEPLEILPKQEHRPAIIIHPCSDTSDDDDDDDPIIDEFGRKKHGSIEAKRRANIFHDAILIPGEQQIRQTAGDGDKLTS